MVVFWRICILDTTCILKWELNKVLRNAKVHIVDMVGKDLIEQTSENGTKRQLGRGGLEENL